jgi:hypothetical protein
MVKICNQVIIAKLIFELANCTCPIKNKMLKSATQLCLIVVMLFGTLKKIVIFKCFITK